MAKRIFAWVLLAGFLFLLVNIILLHFFWQLSVVIYLIIMFGFLFTNSGRNNYSKPIVPTDKLPEGEGGDEADKVASEADGDAYGEGEANSEGNKGNEEEKRGKDSGE